ncbi:hypothetical protein SLEP1_g39552 [Rubroshorea leprosula]|uniref:Reverse transcriptase domain-containing protein n=1 Tax=Rubroshorea leprosula TaxID=152421 RepID=A0AAV5L120_9ROSI|nr:hypothetical protein SLEP1_g39552 [Rubroshorea leprosula]
MAENILLAHELVKNYHRESLDPRCALKIDIMKAFDLVSWNFIFQVLIALGFPTQFVDWIRACITSAMFSISFNGNLISYFLGRRGVRQGDPLSHYIFVICMEIIYRMLNKAASEGQIAFHHNCAKTQLTHLCFADDLIIFTDGSTSSLSAIDKVLQDFYSFSGIPLITGKLSKELKPLIAKITDRMTSWAAKHLSFTVETAKGAKVKWQSICTAKQEGGLGLKGLDLWNIACIMRKILELRQKARQLEKHIPGDGKDIFLWHDNWHPSGPLIEAYGARIVSDVAKPFQGKLAVVVHGNYWNWPPAHSLQLVQIHAALFDNICPQEGVRDAVVWLPSASGNFQTGKTWN